MYLGVSSQKIDLQIEEVKGAGMSLLSRVSYYYADKVADANSNPDRIQISDRRSLDPLKSIGRRLRSLISGPLSLRRLLSWATFDKNGKRNDKNTMAFFLLLLACCFAGVSLPDQDTAAASARG